MEKGKRLVYYPGTNGALMAQQDQKQTVTWSRVGSTHQSLNDVVTDALRQAILMGEFKPGQRLPETQLADLFEVSRIPIREALRVLSFEGLVEISPRKGARVVSLSPEELGELIELRAELESISARNAARYCDDATKAAMGELLKKGGQAKQKNDIETLRQLNGEFHIVLADAGKNRYLRNFMQSLRDRTYWVFSNISDERVTESWAEHAAILESVIGQDEKRAATLAANHVKQVGRAVLEEIS